MFNITAMFFFTLQVCLTLEETLIHAEVGEVLTNG